MAGARAMAGGQFGVVLRRVESLFQAGDVAGLNEAMLRTSPTAPNDANHTERSLPMARALPTIHRPLPEQKFGMVGRVSPHEFRASRARPTAPDVNRTAPQPGNIITPSPLSGLG